MIVLLLSSLAAASDQLYAPDPTTNDAFGLAVDGAGDVDADGFDDLIVGAYGAGDYTGEAYLFFGGASGVDTSPGEVLEASDGGPWRYFGYPVRGMGDLNGDGFDDIATSGQGPDDGAGRAYLYAGTSSGLDTEVGLTPSGVSSWDTYGHGLAAGDIDGDGLSDVVAGSPGDDGLASDGGAVWVSLGGTDLSALSSSRPYPGTGVSSASLGAVVASGGRATRCRRRAGRLPCRTI